MLSVKLVRSLVLGESLIDHHHHHHHIHDDDILTHVEYDADNDDDYHHHNHTHLQKINKNKTQNINGSKMKNKKKKKMPLLLFIPTNELISDTFRLATIAREIGMNFYPTNSLSHLLFSWPSSSSSSSSTTSCTLPSCSTSSPFSTFSPFSTPSSSNNRPSVSSNATTSTSTSTYSTTLSTFWSNSIPNDAVPLPFPSLSTVSSISLLRYFVSLSKNLFKLVFLKIEPNSRFNFGYNYDYDCVSNVALISRVSGKQVNTMGEFSRVLAGNGWALFRSSENKNTTSSSSSSSSSSLSSSVVYLFRKEDWNRIRAKKMINGDNGGECRIRELRLPALDFKNGVSLRILQYILLMTDDLFYLA